MWICSGQHQVWRNLVNCINVLFFLIFQEFTFLKELRAACFFMGEKTHLCSLYLLVSLKGTTVLPLWASVHFDPLCWENPKTFDPAHFLDKNGEFQKKDAYFPFSAGNRGVMANLVIQGLQGWSVTYKAAELLLHLCWWVLFFLPALATICISFKKSLPRTWIGKWQNHWESDSIMKENVWTF